jgi:hypothetical protein
MQEHTMHREQISGPGELVATVPYLLGFHPEHSLVAVCLKDRNLRCVFRVDLPDHTEHLDDMPTLTRQAQNNNCDAVVLIAFGEADIAEAALRYTAMAFTGTSIDTMDLIQVIGDRWFSLDCLGDCCPPEGRPIPDGSSAGELIAMVAGPALPNREALTELLEPVSQERRQAVADAIASASCEWAAMSEPERRAAAMSAVQAQQELTVHLPGPDEVARLALAVTRFDVRDFVLGFARDQASVARTDLWIWIARHLDGALVAPAATIAAYTAYVGGDGVLAVECLTLALRAEPDYQLAALLLFALQEGLPIAAFHHLLTDD